jgi:hypothetical protein
MSIPDISDIPIVIDDIPDIPKAEVIPKRIVKHITEMTEQEREKIFRGCELSRESYERCKKDYHCKRDRCKEMREENEREEKDRINKLLVLEQRNQILEEHARASEERINSKEKEFAEYIRRADELHNNYKIETDAKIEKLAGLIAQLLKK